MCIGLEQMVYDLLAIGFLVVVVAVWIGPVWKFSFGNNIYFELNLLSHHLYIRTYRWDYWKQWFIVGI